VGAVRNGEAEREGRGDEDAGVCKCLGFWIRLGLLRVGWVFRGAGVFGEKSSGCVSARRGSWVGGVSERPLDDSERDVMFE